MSSPRFHLQVAKDFLESSRRAIKAELLSLAAVGLILAAENSVYSVISCFKPPSKIEDPIVELKLLVDEGGEDVSYVSTLLKDFIEISQYVLYTYRELVMRGDVIEERTPSQVVTKDEVLEVLNKVEEVVEVAEKILEKCS